MWRNKKFISLLLIPLLLVALTGCQQQEQITINVSAASSLTETMTKIAGQYEISHPVKINLNFGGTNTLKTQVREGFATDLFLSANFEHYDDLMQEGYIHKGEKLAENQLCLVINKENDKVKSLEDMGKDGVKVIFANDTVPVGKYTNEVIEKLNEAYGLDFAERVHNNVVSKESNVRQMLTKIVLNEGDCALVYTTDITKDVEEKVTIIPIPEEYNVIGEYYMGMIAEQNEDVQGFYEYILSEEGKKVFEEYGFKAIDR